MHLQESNSSWHVLQSGQGFDEQWLPIFSSQPDGCCFVIDSRVHVDLSAPDKNPYGQGKREVSVSSYKRVTELDHFREASASVLKRAQIRYFSQENKLFCKRSYFHENGVGNGLIFIHPLLPCSLQQHSFSPYYINKHARTHMHALVRTCSHTYTHVRTHIRTHTIAPNLTFSLSCLSVMFFHLNY